MTKILRTFIDLCTVEGGIWIRISLGSNLLVLDLNKPNPRNQTIFRNLQVHEEVIKILKLPYRFENSFLLTSLMLFSQKISPAYRPIFKLCYLFIKQFCLHNKSKSRDYVPIHTLVEMTYKLFRLLTSLFFLLEFFFLSQLGMQLNIADT